MRTFKDLRFDYAVSEIVGGLILVLVAVLVFIPIYMYVFPLPFPAADPNIKLRGYVTENGLIAIEHMGGNALSDYKIEVRQLDGTLLNTSRFDKPEDRWEIGEIKFPVNDLYLVSDEDKVAVTIYNYDKEGNVQDVFYGIFKGKSSSVEFTGIPMLITSLLTDSTEEDLICFNYSINPSINASSFIYNWSVNNEPIMDILLPFDTNKTDTTRDYSGGGHNCVINGSQWRNNGVIGGCYEFDGINDHITIPYCFDSGLIDEITIETWIKTSVDNAAIASFDSEKYWTLGIQNGKTQFITKTSSGLHKLTGETNVIDDEWHHIAASYDYSTGNVTIYVDGMIEKTENAHTPGEKLGDGSSPTGFIGTTGGESSSGTWDMLTYDDFEEGFGNYTDGGRDCQLYTDGTHAHQGNNAANIQDNSGVDSSFYLTNGVDVDTPGYTTLTIDFWFIAISMENGEDFWVQYYDGNQWHTVADYDSGDEFINNQFYHEKIWVNETQYTFPTNMKIRFQCDASSDYDDVYIDQIYVNATTGNIVFSNFTGLIDEFHIYNRVLSKQQIYQNYLSSREGSSDKSIIVSEETSVGENWKCCVTPNDGERDGELVQSNTVQIKNYGGGEK